MPLSIKSSTMPELGGFQVFENRESKAIEAVYKFPPKPSTSVSAQDKVFHLGCNNAMHSYKIDFGGDDEIQHKFNGEERR